jgi:hypothetical protein
MDNKDILSYFGGITSAEIRLTDAIDRKLLCPFQYFGVTDQIDLSLRSNGLDGATIWRSLTVFLQQLDTGLQLTFENFTQFHGLSLYEFYGGRTGNRSLYGLMVEAKLIEPFEWENSEYLTKRIPALLGLNSRRLLLFILEYLEQGRQPQSEEEKLMLSMFYYTFVQSLLSLDLKGLNKGFRQHWLAPTSLMRLKKF